MENATTRIRALNDELRQRHRGGMVVITDGVEALGVQTALEVILAVAEFGEFTEDNDPHGEHDFGSLDLRGERFFWKIDYYDKELAFASPDASDASVTSRVMTVMRADEY